MKKTKSLTKTFLVAIFAFAMLFSGLAFVLSSSLQLVYATGDGWTWSNGSLTNQSSSTLPNATVGSTYSVMISSDNTDITSITVDISPSGSGLTGSQSGFLNSDVNISGTPITAGTYTVTCTAYQSTELVSTKVYSLSIGAPVDSGTWTWSSGSLSNQSSNVLPNATVNQNYYVVIHCAEGDINSTSYITISPSLTFNALVGATHTFSMIPDLDVQGQPTTAGTYTVVCTCDSYSKTYTLTVDPADDGWTWSSGSLTNQSSSTLPDAVVGEGYSIIITSPYDAGDCILGTTISYSSTGSIQNPIFVEPGVPYSSNNNIAGISNGVPTYAGTYIAHVENDCGSKDYSLTVKAKVIYDANGATSGTAPTDSNSPYAQGDIATVLAGTGLIKDGYVFNGWNTQANGKGTSYAVGSSLTVGTTNTILYADWVKVITSQPNYFSGYGVVTNTALTGTITYQWYKQATGETAEAILGATSNSFPASITLENVNYYCEIFIDGTKVATSNSVLPIKIVFNGNTADSGTVPSIQYRLYKNGYDAVSLPANPFTKADYKFVGWSNNSSATSGSTSSYYYVGYGNDVDGTITLYAIWLKEITITETTQQYVYDGTTKAFSITGATDNLNDFTIAYSTANPTDAGSYNVTITRAADSTYAAFNKTITGGLIINKATQTVTVNTTAMSKTYDKAVVNDPVYSRNGDGVVTIKYRLQNEFEYQYTTTKPTKSGAYYVKIMVAEGTNYLAGEVVGEFTIEKIRIGIDWSNTTIIYDGKPHQPTMVATGVLEGDTVTLKLEEGSKTDVFAAWVHAIFTTSQINYLLPKDPTKVFRITAAPLTVTTGSNSKTYDGNPLTDSSATITGLVNNETATITATGSQTNAGVSQNTYTISWGTAKESNYQISETLGTLTVNKKTPTITITNDISKVYDLVAVSAPEYTNNSEENVTIEYKLASESDTEYSTTPPTDAGLYVVKVSVAEGINYLAGSATANFTITPSYTVIYEKNISGDVSNMPTDENRYLEDASVTISTSIPTKDGYKFLGWNTDKDATTAEVFADNKITIGTSNITLYAIWEDLKYNSAITITMTELAYNVKKADLNVAVGDNKLKVVGSNIWYYNYETEQNEVATTVLKPGDYVVCVVISGKNSSYYFENYNDSYYNTMNVPENNLFRIGRFSGVTSLAVSSYNLDSYSLFGTKSNKASENIYLCVTICYQLSGKTVSYEANAGEDDVIGMPTTDTTEYLEGTPVVVNTTATPTRSGYKFLGWNTDKDATTAEVFADNKIAMGTSDITLYAIWKKIIALEPLISNDYEVIVNESFLSDATYKWYKLSKSWLSAYNNNVSFVNLVSENGGTLSGPVNISGRYGFGVGENVYSLRFKVNGTATITNCLLNDGYYYPTYDSTLNLYYIEASNYSDAQFTDVEICVGSLVEISEETNAKIGNIALENTSYCCVVTLSGGETATSDFISTKTVLFNRNDNTSDTLDNIYQFDGRNITLPLITRTGFVLAGWKTNNTIYQSTYTVNSNDVTLTAVWNHTCHDVVYDIEFTNEFLNGLSGNNYGKTLPSGNYYITEDITILHRINIEGVVNICLLGHKVEFTKSKYFIVNTNGTLNIVDCENVIRKWNTEKNGEEVINFGCWVEDENGVYQTSGGVLTSKVNGDDVYKVVTLNSNAHLTLDGVNIVGFYNNNSNSSIIHIGNNSNTLIKNCNFKGNGISNNSLIFMENSTLTLENVDVEYNYSKKLMDISHYSSNIYIGNNVKITNNYDSYGSDKTVGIIINSSNDSSNLYFTSENPTNIEIVLSMKSINYNDNKITSTGTNSDCSSIFSFGTYSNSNNYVTNSDNKYTIRSIADNNSKYYVYICVKHHVTYLAEGLKSGSVPVDNNIYYNGDTFEISSLNNITKSGYIFDGWMYNGQIKTGTFDIGYSDVVLTASWFSKTLVFDTDDGLFYYAEKYESKKLVCNELDDMYKYKKETKTLSIKDFYYDAETKNAICINNEVNIIVVGNNNIIKSNEDFALCLGEKGTISGNGTLTLYGALQFCGNEDNIKDALFEIKDVNIIIDYEVPYKENDTGWYFGFALEYCSFKMTSGKLTSKITLCKSNLNEESTATGFSFFALVSEVDCVVSWYENEVLSVHNLLDIESYYKISGKIIDLENEIFDAAKYCEITTFIVTEQPNKDNEFEFETDMQVNYQWYKVETITKIPTQDDFNSEITQLSTDENENLIIEVLEDDGDIYGYVCLTNETVEQYNIIKFKSNSLLIQDEAYNAFFTMQYTKIDEDLYQYSCKILNPIFGYKLVIVGSDKEFVLSDFVLESEYKKVDGATNSTFTPIEAGEYFCIASLGDSTKTSNTVNVYEIKFNDDLETEVINSILDFEGKNVSLQNKALTKDGYKFLGWSLTNDNDKSTVLNLYTISNLNATDEIINLYAVWEEQKPFILIEQTWFWLIIAFLILLLIYVLFFTKRKITFIVNDKEKSTIKIKPFKQFQINGLLSNYKWFVDEKLLKPLKKQKIGLFSVKLYGSDNLNFKDNVKSENKIEKNNNSNKSINSIKPNFKKLNIENGISIKDSLELASISYNKLNITKKNIANYLKDDFKDIEVNNRKNKTATGLPLADTHYKTFNDKKVCFAYVYELENKNLMLLVKLDDKNYVKSLAKNYLISKSSFPKSKFDWYTIIINDKFKSCNEVYDILKNAYNQTKC